MQVTGLCARKPIGAGLERDLVVKVVQQKLCQDAKDIQHWAFPQRNMLSIVTLNFQAKKNFINSGSQLSYL